MLFWSHATAAAINAGKVMVQGASTQDYFSAVRAINIAEWQMFAIRTIKYLTHRYRNKTLEQIVKNRKKIHNRWEELSSFRGFNYIFESNDSPKLTIIA